MDSAGAEKKADLNQPVANMKSNRRLDILMIMTIAFPVLTEVFHILIAYPLMLIIYVLHAKPTNGIGKIIYSAEYLCAVAASIGVCRLIWPRPIVVSLPNEYGSTGS